MGARRKKGKTPKPTGKVSSMRGLADPEDILAALEEYVKKKSEDKPETEWLSMLAAPKLLPHVADRIRAQVDTFTKPSRSAVFSVCLNIGSDRLGAAAEVGALFEQKQRLDKADDDVDGDVLDEVCELAGSFPIALSSRGAYRSQRINARVPEDAKKWLQTSATDLGISISSLAVVVIVMALDGQRCLHPRHAEEIAVMKEAFLKRLRFRQRILEAGLEMLEETSPESCTE